jgi:hypothetical protein
MSVMADRRKDWGSSHVASTDPLSAAPTAASQNLERFCKAQPQRHCSGECTFELVTVVTCAFEPAQWVFVELKIKTLRRTNMKHFHFCEERILGGASIFVELHAITAMGYMRKELTDGTFVKCR